MAVHHGFGNLATNPGARLRGIKTLCEKAELPEIYQFVLSPKTGSERLEHFWLCGDVRRP